jgi:hypothetical protein
MKKYFIPALVLLLTACNSGKSDTQGTAVRKDSITAKNDSGTITVQPQDQSGKIDIESFGNIKIGQHYTETIKVVGDPGSKSKATEWSADGLLHEDWSWAEKGLMLNMSSDKANVEGSLAIASITAISPCTFKTKAGMGIGSSYAEVEQAYKKNIDPESTNKEQITVGSVYGGIIFSFKDAKVSKIFLGAAAE